MAIDRGNETTTQLLTLLNVSATKAGKRKWILDDAKPVEKLNKRRNVQFGEVQVKELEDSPEETPKDVDEGNTLVDDEEEANEIEAGDEAAQGAYEGCISGVMLLTVYQTTLRTLTKAILDLTPLTYLIQNAKR